MEAHCYRPDTFTVAETTAAESFTISQTKQKILYNSRAEDSSENNELISLLITKNDKTQTIRMNWNQTLQPKELNETKTATCLN